MSQSQYEKQVVTSPSYDYFQMLFEGADIYSALWQPMLKSVGRWQLEVAGLSVKQSQAVLAWSRDVARCWTPADAVAANVRYLETVSSQYALSSQRLAATVSQAVETPVLSDVVQLPVKRGHDVIELPDLPDGSVDHVLPRKVA
jgi:hypothetical protein